MWKEWLTDDPVELVLPEIIPTFFPLALIEQFFMLPIKDFES